MSLGQYEVARDHQQFVSIMDASQLKIQELTQLILYSTSELTKTLEELLHFNKEAKCSTIELIRLYALKESELYSQLNKMRM